MGFERALPHSSADVVLCVGADGRVLIAQILEILCPIHYLRC